MNPILDPTVYLPDAEARIMPDGRVYLYGSHDNPGDTEFCSTNYVTYSSTDLIHWQDHGIIFNSTDKKHGVNNGLTLGAPDCIVSHNRYYLYYCMYGNRMGVAVADKPDGPFKNLGPVTPADGQSIDPAIFIDDDGQAYYFWGQFNLRGGQLATDMQTIIPTTINTNILSEHEHGFHEGASIRKIKGIYYLTYTDISRGRATSLAYATAKQPLGPYTKRGIIIDNTGSDSSSWNNHGSIELVNHQLYVFYHRSSQNSIYNRRLCIEPLTLNVDGSINEVQMSSTGVETALPVNQPITVSRLSRMRLKLPFNALIEPMALHPLGSADTLAYVKNNDWIQFDHVDFGHNCQQFKISLATPKPMRVEVWLENNHKIGTIKINHPGPDWQTYQIYHGTLAKTAGIHRVWLKFGAENHAVGRLGNLKSVQFIEEREK
ncbi:xylosidase [Lactobacillus sp. CBA3606]|uniref:family 43 glycosylhydrolase n=1 Tax=Lactobacillus sp. CBA3606 TaxID=2099789 RepID=UPI000CFCE7BD|nr:family 43 glycosylhydrolase [Lactobacillus sp. CBA3606]AVK64109.1 xylosidase [Lactobacillus sp. CBA3606]